MDEQSKRKALREYFAPPPKSTGPIVLFVGGVILLLIGLTDIRNLGANIVIGFFMTIAGGVWLYSRNSKKGKLPTDKQVDKWFQEDLQRIVEQSLSKLGLDKSQVVREPLPITGPILWTTNGISSEDLRWKKGEDNVVRFAINRITIIQLSDQLLAAYACDFNFLKSVTLNETTSEYHYRDVVAVSTQEDSTSYILPTGVSLVKAQTFRVSVASGERIEVTIAAAKLAEITGGSIPTTGAEKAVQVIRTMLREKKG